MPVRSHGPAFKDADEDIMLMRGSLLPQMLKGGRHTHPIGYHYWPLKT